MRNRGTQRLQLPWPLKGLVQDNTNFGDQPPLTTREALNVRSIDPKTGRVRGGQRSGLSRWMPNPVNGANKIQDLATVIADDRLVTYAAIDPVTDMVEAAFTGTTASLNLPRNSGATVLDPYFNGSLGVVIDEGGNSFFLDGRAGITKYNHDGVKLFTIALPVEDDKDLCRTLFVDDLGFIFAAVSGGRLISDEHLGSQATARIFCYQQEPENKFTLLWQLEPGAFTERLRVKDDLLYTAQNDQAARRAYVRVYRNIDAKPVLDWEREVSYPINDIAVSAEKGDVYFTSPTYVRRGKYPLSEDTTLATEDWRVEIDGKASLTIWSHHRAQTIDLSDVVGSELDDNPGILIWRDMSGNGRHWYYNTVDGGSGGVGNQTPPTLRTNGFAGRPAVAFDGDTQSMVSLANPGVAVGLKDAQRTPIPGYTGGMFALVMVARLARGADPRCVLFLPNDAASTTDHLLLQNAADDASPIGGTASSGAVSYYADTAAGDPGAGNGGHLESGTVDATTEAVILTIIWDGGVDPGASTSKTKCTFRVNGEPIDRCGGEALEITGPLRLGHDPNVDVLNFKGEIYEMVVLARKDDGSLTEPKILTHPKYPDTAFALPAGDTTELERIEGQLAHRYGLSHILSSSASTFPHPYGRDPQDAGVILDQYQIGPPNRLGTFAPSIVGRLAWLFGLVGKIASGNAGIRWIAFDNDVTFVSTDAGGIGDAVEATLDGNLYTAGSSSLHPNIVRKVMDLGDDYSLESADGGWFDNPASGTQDIGLYPYIRLATDKFDNLYLPGHYEVSAGTGSSPSPEILTVYDKLGNVLFDFEDLDDELDIGATINAVAVDPRIPEYGTVSPANVAEWVALAGEFRTDQAFNIAKFRLIEVAAQTGSARTMKVLAVSAGNVYSVDTTAATLVTDGTAALAATAKYIQHAVLDGLVYFADGEKTMVYNQKTNTIAKFTSESPGGIPENGRCKLIVPWGPTLVLAGSPDDPTHWYRSGFGEPGDFDFFPPVPEAGSAVMGVNSRAGATPDIITTLFPINDDLLLFGLDSSTYVLRGNPNDGGVLDLLGHETGLAFGQSVCQDDHGRVWAMGREGGVYLVTGTGLKSVTEGRIDRRLRDIDYETHYVRCYWNPEDQGIHWFLHPFGAGGTVMRHWFHDLRNDAWWEDEFGKAAVQPTAGILIDGDLPEDRVFLIGCEDGRVRLWDEDALTDDDVACDSYVLFGPLAPGGLDHEYGFAQATFVLARDQAGARLQGYAQNEPDKLGGVKFSAVLSPGRNAPRLERMSASHCWYRLRNGAQERWAYESGSVMAFPMAHARPR